MVEMTMIRNLASLRLGGGISESEEPLVTFVVNQIKAIREHPDRKA